MPTPQELDGASIPALREFLRSPDPAERADAACALGDRLRAREVRRLEPEVVDEIAVLLEDEVPMVQFEAAVALAETRDERATELLLEAIRYRHFRLDGIRALGTLGDSAAIEPLQQLMGRWLMPWADKLQAAAALCALNDPAGEQYLVDKLDSRRRAERAAAIHFVGESRHSEALQILSGLLQDPREGMRDVAARALGLLGDPAAKPVLQAACDGADEELREDIEDALTRLGRELR